ncbi:TonB-dependent receptor plug domain-containing protein [Microbulbifer sp. SH-1]|uniref:TonB-dependent receptor domain-containing protein n=1 Tax=Microbulbifer sp. SH-1 TaxID=2681547 RepID=UPI00140C2E47|nr:TonB-dependent receptor [Microbulbifer sp. SH-1]QIL90934.1 TonB-dependent receptor plug domain-containing protein [Microbulbifer sp. SH-1]
MPKTCFGSLRALVLTAHCCASATAFATEAAPDVAVEDLPASTRTGVEAHSSSAITYFFEIPTQPLDQALLAFSRQTGLAVMVATSGQQSSPIPDTQAPPVKGEYSAEAAMGLLLAHTEFRYRRVDGQGMVILPPRQERIADEPQEEVPAPALLEEVEVVASKRRTNLQRTPLTVTAISGGTLEERRIDSLEQLAAEVPSLQVARNGDHTASMLYMRGVGSDNHTEAGDSGVATHVDGIFSSRVQGSAVMLYDLDRVEVLRGPQGTLFGRNSTGGVINYHTARPESEWSSSVAVSLGSYRQRKLSAVANAPLTDDWSLRWAAAAERADSYIDYAEGSAWAARAHRYNNTDLFSHRLSSSWQINSGLNWWLSYERFEDRGAGSVPLVDYDTAVMIDTPGRTRLDQDALRSRLELELPGGASLAYIAGYGLNERSQDWDEDRSGAVGSETDPAIYHQSNRTIWSEYRARQHELQLKSSDEQRLRWLLAYFSFAEKNAIRFDLEHQEADGSGWGDAPAHSFQQPNRGTRLGAFYGQVDYDLSQAWEISAGARSGRDQRYDRGGRNIACPDLIRSDRGGELGEIAVNRESAADGQCFVANYNDVDRTWDSTTAMARLTYRPTDQAMLYLHYAEGFKPGIVQDGAKLSGVYNGADDPAYQSALQALIERNNGGAAFVGPETSTNIELGFKLGLQGGAMTLNGALFDTRYRDLQVSGVAVEEDGTELVRSINAPSATIRGLELELNWASSPNGRLTGFLSLLDARYNRFLTVDNEFPQHGQTWNPGADNPDIPDLVDFSGNRLKQVPEISLGLNYRHGLALGSWGRATARVGLRYAGDMYFDEANRGDRRGMLLDNGSGEWVPDPAGPARNVDRQAAWSLWSAGLKFEPASANWWLDLYGDNLTNEAVANDVHEADIPSPEYYYGAPRSFGLRVGMKFD